MKIKYLSSAEPRKRAAKTRPQFSGRTWYSDGKDVKKYPKTHQSMSILDNICHLARHLHSSRHSTNFYGYPYFMIRSLLFSGNLGSFLPATM
jgi:hypothetical protein